MLCLDAAIWLHHTVRQKNKAFLFLDAHINWLILLQLHKMIPSHRLLMLMLRMCLSTNIIDLIRVPNAKESLQSTLNFVNKSISKSPAVGFLWNAVLKEHLKSFQVWSEVSEWRFHWLKVHFRIFPWNQSCCSIMHQCSCSHSSTNYCREMSLQSMFCKPAMRAAVPVEKRVSTSLWRLATGDCYRTCGLMMEVTKSTAI